MVDVYAGLSRQEDDITKDLILVAIDGTSFKVHSRIILRRWANPGQKLSSDESHLSLPRIQTTIHSALLNLVIDYCYNIKIDPYAHDFIIIEQLLNFAEYCPLNELILKIMNALIEKLTVDNCLTLWKLCKRFNLRASFKVHDFVLYHLVGHIDESLNLLYDWYRLSAGEVEFILADDFLHTRAGESDVWRLACLWMRVDRPTRTLHAWRFARLLRLLDIAEFNAIIARDSFKMLPENFREMTIFGIAKARHPRDLIAVFGGRRRLLTHLTNMTSVEVEIYDKRTHVWRNASFICGVLSNTHTMVTLGSDVYLIEERLLNNGFRVMTAPKRYLDTASWSNRAPMHCENRSNAASCVLNGRIYVMGGGNVLNTVERYDPVTNQWTKMPNMSTRRMNAAAVALDGRVYVIGGSDGIRLLETVEVFDEETGTWTEQRGTLATARKAHSAVAWNGGILVAGGLVAFPVEAANEYQAINSVEIFNPIRNTWTTGPPMRGVRFSFSLLAFDDDVLAIGGMATVDQSLNTVERFDGTSWRLDSHLKEPRGQHQACVLRNWPLTVGLMKTLEPTLLTRRTHHTLGQRSTRFSWSAICEEKAKETAHFPS